MKSKQFSVGGVLLLLLVVLMATPAYSQKGQAVYSVRGHGTWFLITGKPEDEAQYTEQISINAWVDDTGVVHGMVVWTSVYHTLPADPADPIDPPGPGSSGFPFYIEVTALNVQCNEAYVEGVVVSSPQDRSLEGLQGALTIVDNGHGGSDPSDTINGIPIEAGDLTVTRSESTPEGYSCQLPYSGDCLNRPPGSICVEYDDEYTWLVYDSIQGWRYDGDWQGLPIQVAMGFSGEYFHIIGTNYVKYEPY